MYLSERLACLGIMGSQSRAPIKPFQYHSFVIFEGFYKVGGGLINPPWFREMRVSRADVRLIKFQINRKMVNTIWFLFDLIWFRKDFPVCSSHQWLLQSVAWIVASEAFVMDRNIISSTVLRFIINLSTVDMIFRSIR